MKMPDKLRFIRAVTNPYGRMSIDSMCLGLGSSSLTRAGLNPCPSIRHARILSVNNATGARFPADIVFTQKHRFLDLRLSPLSKVSDDLHRRPGATNPSSPSPTAR
ncbi:hypothetical protein B0H14DRAFT_3448174 [Mycena olivaceomarginata]|nr:hypothetical protein B0H14DRAFT_3448174 [Mycena olivaceomarginata]